MIPKTGLFLLAVLLLSGCLGSKKVKFDTVGTPPSHAPWDALLQKNVGDDGWVDYQAMQQDSAQLNAYLESLEANPPSAKQWTREQQMAYWINAYNAYTVQIVARNYPVESIKDIGPSKPIPFVNTVWDIKFIEIGGEAFDLNNIEHAMLRKPFGDPRVHFAIVCASYSCPRLLNRAYFPETLDQQLDEMARDFIADNRKNQVGDGSFLKLSKIFSWYKGDFIDKEHPTIQSYISQYSDVAIQPEAEVESLEYNWSLNGLQ